MQAARRRTALTVGLLAAAAVLTACTGSQHKDDGDARRPDPDLPVRARAVAATDALLAAYDVVLAGPGAAQAAQLQPLRAELLQHRAAFAQGLPDASASASRPANSGSQPASAPPSAGASATAPAAATPATVAGLGAAERRTAEARLADLSAASPDLARLLASVSASDALHAAALGDTTPVTDPAPATPVTPSPSASRSPSPSPSQSLSRSPAGSPSATTAGTASPSAGGAPLATEAATAVQSALAAEHAAVYGYGVVGAKLPDDQRRADARAGYAAHEAERDTWRRLLAGAGASPGAAAPGYQLPFPVSDATGATALAAHIETRLRDTYAELVAALPADRRAPAADALRIAALQARHWGAASTAFPGLPDPATATASGSPDASPGAAKAAATGH